MTRHLRTIRHRTARACRAVYRFCGPVAGAVRGELSSKERQRALATAAVYGLTSGATFWGTVKHPDTLTGVVVPLATAALGGAMDAMSRHQHGADPDAPPDAPGPPQNL